MPENEPSAISHPVPFDRVAEIYDTDFTNTPLGRRKRDLVQSYLQTILHPDWNVLELNCGTGEDALWMSDYVRQITATDISSGMVEVAEQKREARQIGNIRFARMAIEDLWRDHAEHLPFNREERFDLIFSNFDGMNCLADLSPLPEGLHRHLRSDGHLIIVMMARFCVLETLAGLLQGNPGKAFQRRRSGGSKVHIGKGSAVQTFFHPVKRIMQLFQDHGFYVVDVRGIGLITPPTSLRDFYHRHINIFRRFEWLEEKLSPIFPFDRMGDHVLIHVRRNNREPRENRGKENGH